MTRKPEVRILEHETTDVMNKKELTAEELAAIEARSMKARSEFVARHKENPGPITNHDVARIFGMDEEMIDDLFGEEGNESGDGITDGDPGKISG